MVVLQVQVPVELELRKRGEWESLPVSVRLEKQCVIITADVDTASLIPNTNNPHDPHLGVPPLIKVNGKTFQPLVLTMKFFPYLLVLLLVYSEVCSFISYYTYKQIESSSRDSRIKK